MKKFTFNQTNIEELSNDIELHTDELHIWNDFYGQASILKKKIFINKKSLYFTIEHGVSIDDIIWHVDKNSILKSSIVFSDFRKEVYKNQTNKYVFNIGSIINYVDLKDSYTKDGSIYFLTHSTHHIDVDLNLKRIIVELNSLPSHLKPEYICVYWKDIQRNKHKIFIDNGFKVLTAGHMYDKLFLYRLKEILLNFKYLITSEMGSHVFHAFNCGLEIIYPESLNSTYLDKKYNLSSFYEDFKEKQELNLSVTKHEKINELFYEIFSDKSNHTKKDKNNFLYQYSNDHKLNSLELTLINFLSYLKFRIKSSSKFQNLIDYFLNRLEKKFSKKILKSKTNFEFI